MLCVTWPCFLGLLLFGLVSGLLVQLLLLVLMMLLCGHTLLVSFLGSLHWLFGRIDLGVGGISYVELLILYELWAGQQLILEKAHNRYLRPGRPISVSAVPFGPGIDIWRSCRFIGALNEVSLHAAWWSWSVCTMLHWCLSLQAAVCWLGEL